VSNLLVEYFLKIRISCPIQKMIAAYCHILAAKCLFCPLTPGTVIAGYP
jgi:hypothetical protein